MAEKSGCGIRVNLAEIPISAAAKKLDGEVAIDEKGHFKISAAVAGALFDGEDFELAVTVTSETADKILADKNCPSSLTRIGSITSTAGFEVVDEGGQVVKILPRGYEH